MNNVNVWTSTMNAYFTKLHRDRRQLSFATIAHEMGLKFGVELTRNAVIGKARRLGLPMRKKPTSPRLVFKSYPRKPRAVVAVEAPIIPVEAALPEVLPPEGLTIYQLNSHTCKWPLGYAHARPPFFYCGEKSLTGRPYCLAHTKRSIGRALVPA